MLKKRIAALEGKALPNKLGVMFFDSIILEADALRHNLPIDITISKVLKLKPDVEVIHFDELGELRTYDELKEMNND